MRIDPKVSIPLTSTRGGRRFLPWVGLLVSALGAFTILPKKAPCFPWSTDMFRSPAVGPMSRTPRNQPDGTLAENALPELKMEQASAKRQNPLPVSRETVSAGRPLFLTDCMPCHGSNGKGDGPVVVVLETKPYDLKSSTVIKLSDGDIYSTIRDGNKAMPPYGDTLTVEETWQVVSYVRYLQGLGLSEHRQ